MKTELKTKLLKSDGTVTEITPADPKRGFTLQELYKMLDCQMVEVHDLANGQLIIIDEEGRLNDELIKNEEATKLWKEGRPSSKEYREMMKAKYGNMFIDASMNDDSTDEDAIYGNAIVCDPKEFK